MCGACAPSFQLFWEQKGEREQYHMGWDLYWPSYSSNSWNEGAHGPLISCRSGSLLKIWRTLWPSSWSTGHVLPHFSWKGAGKPRLKMAGARHFVLCFGSVPPSTHAASSFLPKATWAGEGASAECIWGGERHACSAPLCPLVLLFCGGSSGCPPSKNGPLPQNPGCSLPPEKKKLPVSSNISFSTNKYRNGTSWLLHADLSLQCVQPWKLSAEIETTKQEPHLENPLQMEINSCKKASSTHVSFAVCISFYLQLIFSKLGLVFLLLW